jgi:uncharacterized protein YjdB
MSTRVTVTVRTARSKPVTLTALRTAGIPAQMVSGQTALARASYRPARAVRVKVRYESSRPSVLSVDSAGRLVAKRPGTAIITVKAGPRRADVRVRVTAS